MPTSLIVGAGSAAAGVLLALLDDPDQRVTVLDVGTRLEPTLDAARQRLAGTPEAEWSPEDVDQVARPAAAPGKGLPQKRAYGSDFPFRDVGQLNGVTALADSNAAVVSGAYGGFTNVWGAQIMPFSGPTFDRWPITFRALEPHYRVALSEMSLAGDEDDLATLFPLLGAHAGLPPLAHRTRRVLDRYDAHRALVQSRGITVGRARLALRASDCTRCGLCMTGCPYGLIYSASQTLDRLRRDPRVTYVGGALAIGLAQRESSAEVRVKHLATGTVETLSADRIFVGCGGIGTTRLVLGSREHYDRPIHMGESVQFVVPAMSARPTPDPRTERHFTLNQFNVVFDASGDGRDLCQIHFYPYNELFQESLPAVLQRPPAERLKAGLLRRLSVGLGYLPSWASPGVTVLARRAGSDRLPDVIVGQPSSGTWPSMLRANIRALVKVAPALDLWPVIPKTFVSPPGKSYHFGSSFPHSSHPAEMSTDRLGRLPHWNNIHIVDASVFPDVPATTFTLTVMANAHRIATESLRDAR